LELETLTVETKETLERLGNVQLVIGIPSCDPAVSLRDVGDRIFSALQALPNPLRTVVLHSDALATPLSPISGADLHFVPFPFATIPESSASAILEILDAGRKLSADAFCVWSAPPQDMTAAAIVNLIHPVIDGPFDLVVARYIHMRYDALINSAIVYPLTRALYGMRVRFPMASDLAFSASLVQRLLQPDPKTGRPVPRRWIPAFAAGEQFRICQADLDVRLPASPHADVSTALVNVVTPLLADVERDVQTWQRFRSSQAVPVFGAPKVPTETPGPIDVRPMIEAFHSGLRNLLEVWGPVLPPATLLQIKKLGTMPQDQFRFDDALWARCVYDFALAHKLRVMSAAHLLRAMTPLYLAWVAAYALEVQPLSPAQVEERQERLCLAFEEQKPYFLSRWRWPDRFNP